MRYVIINDKKYDVIEDYKEGYQQEEVSSKLTDYFDHYDYVIGDWAYGKLRLKGFCKETNPLFNEINDYAKKEEYLKNNCALECRYFVIEKID